PTTPTPPPRSAPCRGRRGSPWAATPPDRGTAAKPHGPRRATSAHVVRGAAVAGRDEVGEVLDHVGVEVVLGLFGAGQALDLLEQGEGVDPRGAADDLLDEGDRLGGHRQLVEA